MQRDILHPLTQTNAAIPFVTHSSLAGGRNIEKDKTHPTPSTTLMNGAVFVEKFVSVVVEPFD